MGEAQRTPGAVREYKEWKREQAEHRREMAAARAAADASGSGSGEEGEEATVVERVSLSESVVGHSE